MLNILKAGLYSTIQDLGRTGYQQYGIIQSGVMDSVAFRIGNALLQQTNQAAIEMTLIGGDFQFTQPTAIALTGGYMQATLNGKAVAMNQAITIKANDRLTCGPIVHGARSYLCIAGGFLIEPTLNSTSTYVKAGFGGFLGRALTPGDAIAYTASVHPKKSTQINTHSFYEARPIRVLPGTDWAQFHEPVQQQFLQQCYTISLDSDRMGYRLQGAIPLKNHASAELLSEAVTFGTIQVPANGQPIVLMADHQTTGGYAKIAQVIAADLPRLAQHLPKQTITFEHVTLHQAEQAYLKLERQLRIMESLLIN